MEKAIIYLYVFIYCIAWAYFHKYQFLDLKTVRNIRWKSWRIIISIISVLGIYLGQFIHIDWKDVFLACSLGWWVFEIGVNVIGLNENWFYIGGSSQFDNKYKKNKWYIMMIPVIISIIIKLIK